MDYFTDVSKLEVKYILSSFRRQISSDCIELCSHFHEKDFLCFHNSLIRHLDEEKDKSYGVVDSLYTHMMSIAENEPCWEVQIREFVVRMDNMYYSEVLLFCSTLLTDFHTKSECSEFLSLALKFKFMAYGRLKRNQFYYKNSNTVIETMMKFVRYICQYKCIKNVFIKCLNTFLYHYRLLCDGEDYLYPVLTEIFETAHELRCNLLYPLDFQLLLARKMYFTKSFIQNLKRFLIIVKFGHEDCFYKKAMRAFVMLIFLWDKNKFCGFRRKDLLEKNVERKLSKNKYRPYQVLFLHVKVLYDEMDCNYGQELHDECLRVLWASIPDPFLTQDVFLTSFKRAANFPEYFKAWNWYKKIVLNNVNSENSPRPLKHLARIAIRRKLTECAQMPFGIKSLDVPLSLRSYLSLESM